MFIVYVVVIVLCGYWFLMCFLLGVWLCGVGGNFKVIVCSGGLVVCVKVLMYGLVGVLGIFFVLMLVGIIILVDVNIVQCYMLILIVVVILGGGSFIGGKVLFIGVMLGVIMLGIVVLFLFFFNIVLKWQIGLQGVILIIVLLMCILLLVWGEC